MIFASKQAKKSEEQARLRAEWRQQQEELKKAQAGAQAYILRQIELERQTMKLATEQARQAEILQRHEEKIRKHDEEIAKLQFRMDQAEMDIVHWKEQIGNLYALMDIVQAELAQATIGGKTQEKWQRKAITLTNQIHAAEAKLAKAEYEKKCSARKLNEVA